MAEPAVRQQQQALVSDSFGDRILALSDTRVFSFFLWKPKAMLVLSKFGRRNQKSITRRKKSDIVHIIHLSTFPEPVIYDIFQRPYL